MSQAWDKEKIWVRDRNWMITFRTPVLHTCTYIIQTMISTLLILAVLRTHITREPCIWPSSPWVLRSSVVSASDWGVEGHQFLLGTQIFSFSHPCDMLITSFLTFTLFWFPSSNLDVFQLFLILFRVSYVLQDYYYVFFVVVLQSS